MGWWGHSRQCNIAGWLGKHLAYSPHCARQAAVKGADNGQNTCHEVEEERQLCSVSVSTPKTTLSHRLGNVLATAAVLLVSGGKTECLLHLFLSPSRMPRDPLPRRQPCSHHIQHWDHVRECKAQGSNGQDCHLQ